MSSAYIKYITQYFTITLQISQMCTPTNTNCNTAGRKLTFDFFTIPQVTKGHETELLIL